jgi:hypothetical protein
MTNKQKQIRKDISRLITKIESQDLISRYYYVRAVQISDGVTKYAMWDGYTEDSVDSDKALSRYGIKKLREMFDKKKFRKITTVCVNVWKRPKDDK